MSAPYDIVAVEALGGHRLRLMFADGLVSDLDLAKKLESAIGPVFAALRDPAFFARVRIDPELATVMWPNGADLAPDVLHAQATRGHRA